MVFSVTLRALLRSTQAATISSKTSIARPRGLTPKTKIWISRCSSTEASTAKPVEEKLPARFDAVPNLSKHILRSISQNLKFTTMTEVQQRILPYLLAEETKGTSALVQAKTGTGKTAAFMIPVIQRVSEILSESEDLERRSRKPLALVISPTRELAYQIRDEAQKLCSIFPLVERPVIKAVVGGVSRRWEEEKVFQKQGVDILVATPGRLLDYLQEDPKRFRNLQIKVYDEADRLLDQGFAREISDIRSRLERVAKVKQMLMFSATVGKDVVGIAEQELGKNYKLVRTTSKDDVPTHFSVPQSLVLVDKLSDHFEPLVSMLRAHVAEARNGSQFKAIVFLRTGKEVDHYHFLLYHILKNYDIPVIPISSRLSQTARSKNLGKFKAAPTSILVASDVVARGVDVKDITHVFQVGRAMSTEQYIHRVGRTGRAGKSGKGILILSEKERDFYKKLKGLQIKFSDEYKYTPDPALTEEISEVAKRELEWWKKRRREDRLHQLEEKYEAHMRGPKVRQALKIRQSTEIFSKDIDVVSTIISQFGFYRGVISKRDLPSRDMLREVIAGIGHLGLDPNEKPTIDRQTSMTLKSKLALTDREVKEFFVEEKFSRKDKLSL
ncbi:P-loop containing nucleoside triphosphate hydrolase protein [Lipomyces tetrasporus]|uniref:ATP-dependent RNA helicase n=1 Tax=Lipomyces tetrasporus TaxID=54092 RepID=A0AAD7QVF4_9ASCO|nr:P-loop containing nucleoside triphosphate hydrolase protein [Lipomyces tetrasporus]KAJ8101706.1 P-loop containing nucleoside triphosphate hydrolase protein [Lipomyces tetrasporus]